MDYKFTFEDGSEAFAHYGVKGMKWGKHLKLQTLLGGGGGLSDETTDEISRDSLDNDTLDALRDSAKILSANRGNFARGLAQIKAYNQGLKNVDADSRGFVNTRGGKKAALGELGLNAAMTREEATKKLNSDYKKRVKEYTDAKKKSGKTVTLKDRVDLAKRYKEDKKLVDSLPSAAERKKSATTKKSSGSGKIKSSSAKGKEKIKSVLSKSRKVDSNKKKSSAAAKATSNKSIVKDAAKKVSTASKTAKAVKNVTKAPEVDKDGYTVKKKKTPGGVTTVTRTKKTGPITNTKTIDIF